MAEPSTSTEMVRVPILGENGRISDDYIPESIPQAVTAAEQAATSAASSASQALQQAAAAEKAASSATGSVEQAKTYASNASSYMTTAETHAKSAATDAQAASDSASAAATSATAAEESNKSAAKSSADAMGFRNNAVQYRDQAREAAQEAQGYVTTVQQLEQNATNSATAAQNSATSASASAETATTAASQASTSATNAAASAQTASQKADAVLDHYIESASATTLAPGSQATATVADKVLQLGIPKGEKGDTGLGVPEGGSEGQVLTRTADNAEWAYDSGSVYNTEGGAQQLSDTGSMDPIYNFGLTQGGMSASMSVMGDSPEVAADYSTSSASYRNAIGADANGPYVDLNLSGVAGGATKHRYIDDPSKFATSDGIPTTKAVSNAIGAGILTGEVEGYVAHADDAYAQKPREVRIKGKTVNNLWVNPSGTVNGITTTSNEDGTITLSGTMNSSTSTIQVQSYALKPSTQYTFSVDKEIPGGNTAFTLVQFDESGQTTGSNRVIGKDGSTSDTFTTQSNMSSVRMQVYCNRQDTTVSGTYRIMLNEGSTAQPWCPPGLNSVDELSLVTAGKNLFGISQEFSDLSGWQVTQLYDEGDGWVRAETASGPMGIWYKKSKITFMPTTYTVSFEAYANKSAVVDYCYIMDTEDGNVRLQAIFPSVTTERQRVSFKFTLDKELNGSFMVGIGENAVGAELHLRNVQLELGSTATDYEPPTVTQTPLPEVELRSLPNGTCDELVIKADGTCEVERRTAKIVLNGGEEQAIAGSNTAVHEGYYFNILFDMPDNADGTLFSPATQVSDKLRVGNGDAYPNAVGVFMNNLTHKTNARISVDGIETVDGLRAYLQSDPITLVYTTKDDSTEPQSPVTLPALPAPTFNQYHDADVPSDTSTEYERDINIAFANLEAKISELTVNQASS